MKKRLFPVISVTILLLCPATLLSPRKAESAFPAILSDETTIQEMIEQVNESLVSSFHQGLMQCGYRYTGTENCSLAATFISDAFNAMGLDVVFHEWKYKSLQGKNVVATLEGTDTAANATFILSAHYDTVRDSLGANDDGSGVAAMLAIAKVMSQYSFNYTIRFIAFSGEEEGIYGSFSYARDSYDNGENIVADLNLDTVGYANATEDGQILLFVVPQRSVWIPDFAATVAVKYNDIIHLRTETIPDYRGGDHQPFADYGYDSTSIVESSPYEWENSPGDTPDHINWSYLVKVTKLTLAVTAEITQKPIKIQVILRRPLEGALYVFNHLLLRTPFEKRWYWTTRGITSILGTKTEASAEVICSESVRYVVFSIDGTITYTDTQPPYEWTIKGIYFPLVGRHTLKVFAYTASGAVASDEMDLFVVSFSNGFN
jgi:hypothetical protein